MGTSRTVTRFGWSPVRRLYTQSLSLEPDHDHTTEVDTSSAAAVTASTAMSIAVMTPIVTVGMIIIASVLTTPIVGLVVVASIIASIIPSTSIGRPSLRITVMVTFRVLPTTPSIRVLGRDKTGNKQGNSQDRYELENLHKSPLSMVRSVTSLEGSFSQKFHT